MCLLTDCFNEKNAKKSWEEFKLKVQNLSQNYTQFWQTQTRNELASIKSSLKYVNAHIFYGEELEQDWLDLQDCLEQTKDRRHFYSKGNDWLCLEEKPFKKFLHLEDVCNNSKIEALFDQNGHLIKDTEGILNIIYDFYAELYKAEVGAHNDEQVKNFLASIRSLPKVSDSDLTTSITCEEVEKVIKHLQPGKAPGCDRLTADFYLHFIDYISDQLALVFNEIFEDQELTFSQKLAVIVLLYKKGDAAQVTNYWPILLTNCDYKILAYMLVGWIENLLPNVIHSKQTAYMKGWFIGTNVRYVQDVITESVNSGRNTIVHFWTFVKLLIVLITCS